MHYYIIGTDHDLQIAANPDVGLKLLLEFVIDSNDVVLIAEEVIDKNVITFGRQIVGEAKWLPIDMNEAQRKQAGIFGKLEHPRDKALGPNGYYPINPYLSRSEGVREDFWIKRIEERCAESSYGTVIVTCGHNHLPFLAGRVIEKHHSVTLDEYLSYDKAERNGPFVVFDE
jgi:hypothetical protein